MTDVKTLINGYQRFYNKHFVEEPGRYKELANKGQAPKTLVIACSDSRVDPSIIMDVGPGDIFVIRNVANLVPPYQPKGDSYHGTSAALEFAVCNLGVENIIVMGHGFCAGVNALLNNQPVKNDKFSFVQSWVDISKEAKNRVEANHPDASGEEKLHFCEKENIKVSMENLLTFPWVKERVDNGSLEICGWYFSIFNGVLENYDKKSDSFLPIVFK